MGNAEERVTAAGQVGLRLLGAGPPHTWLCHDCAGAEGLRGPAVLILALFSPSVWQTELEDGPTLTSARARPPLPLSAGGNL